jgi:hypothetical protein
MKNQEYNNVRDCSNNSNDNNNNNSQERDIIVKVMKLGMVKGENGR